MPHTIRLLHLRGQDEDARVGAQVCGVRRRYFLNTMATIATVLVRICATALAMAV